MEGTDKPKPILWLSDYEFKPFSAQIQALNGIFCSEVATKSYDLNLSVNDVKKLLSDGEYAGMVVVSDEPTVLARFANKFNVPVFNARFVEAKKPEEEDLILPPNYRLRKLHFVGFSPLV